MFYSPCCGTRICYSALTDTSSTKRNVSHLEFTKYVELMTNLSFLSSPVYGKKSDSGSRTFYGKLGTGERPCVCHHNVKRLQGKLLKWEPISGWTQNLIYMVCEADGYTSFTNQGDVLLPGRNCNTYYWLTRLPRSNKCNWSGINRSLQECKKLYHASKKNANFNQTVTVWATKCFEKGCDIKFIPSNWHIRKHLP